MKTRKVTINHPTNDNYGTRYIVVLLDTKTGRKWWLGRTVRHTQSALWSYAADEAKGIAAVAGCEPEKLTAKIKGKSGHFMLHINEREGLVVKFDGTARDAHGKTLEAFDYV